MSSSAAEPSTGTKSTLRIAVSQSPHTVAGMRMYVIPGARRRTTVVT
jgi:hypothetical protein